MANSRTTQVVTAPTQAYAQADRRRALADALQKRSMAPRDMSAMQGSDPYMLGLTQLGEALMARYAGKGASQAEGQADAQMRGSNANAIEQLAGATQIDSVDGEAPTPLATGGVADNMQRMAEAQARQSGLHSAIDPMDPRQGSAALSQALAAKYMPPQFDPEKALDRKVKMAQIESVAQTAAANREAKLKGLREQITANRGNLDAQLKNRLELQSLENKGDQTVEQMKISAKFAALKDKVDADSADMSKSSDSANGLLDGLTMNYLKLNDMGGIVNADKSTLANIGARVASSDIGQFFGRTAGTDEQTLRNEIEMTRPLLLQAVKQATGMSAQQMNSNVELQLFLKAATDPKSADFQSNMKAIDNIRGFIASNSRRQTAPSAAPAPAAAPTSDPVAAARAEIARRKAASGR